MTSFFMPFVAMPSGPELLIILTIVVLLFGAAKLPELARGAGQALRIFKTETRGLMDKDDADLEELDEHPSSDTTDK